MRIKFQNRRDGPIPSEAVVTIPTVSGSEDVIVHQSQADAHTVEVGFIRETEDGSLLVELPRETMSGRWRIRVPKSAQVAA
jgi:hypothetical protein